MVPCLGRINSSVNIYGRLVTVGSGTCSAAYGCVPNSDLLQTTTCYSKLTPILTTTRTWQHGFQLASIANVISGTVITSHAYTCDAVNRRTQAKLEGNSS
jgi:hypothetical protein